jgi:hypothetical protein
MAGLVGRGALGDLETHGLDLIPFCFLILLIALSRSL